MKTQPTDTKQIMRQDLNSSEKNVEKRDGEEIMRQQVTFNEINAHVTFIERFVHSFIFRWFKFTLKPPI